jgi:hypothetical protein
MKERSQFAVKDNGMNELAGCDWRLGRAFATRGIADCTDFSSEGGTEARGSTSTRSRGGTEAGAEFGDTKSIKDWGNRIAGACK